MPTQESQKYFTYLIFSPMSLCEVGVLVLQVDITRLPREDPQVWVRFCNLLNCMVFIQEAEIQRFLICQFTAAPIQSQELGTQSRIPLAWQGPAYLSHHSALDSAREQEAGSWSRTGQEIRHSSTNVGFPVDSESPNVPDTGHKSSIRCNSTDI